MSGGERASVTGIDWSDPEQTIERIKRVRRWFRWVWNHRWVRRLCGIRDVLMIGPGGTGKTTLGQILSGEYDLLQGIPVRYRQSHGEERYALSDPVAELVAPPGQTFRRDATWTDLLNQLGDGKFSGVMLLVSYGYHSIDAGSIQALGYSRRDEFLAKYPEEKRRDELAVLKKLAEALRQVQRKVWLLTVVSKRDLWWKEETAVRDFYLGGEFAAEIDRLAQHVGASRFRSDRVFCSLVISNFRTLAGDLVKPNAEGYDHEKHAESLQELFAAVDALRRWERGR